MYVVTALIDYDFEVVGMYDDLTDAKNDADMYDHANVDWSFDGRLKRVYTVRNS